MTTADWALVISICSAGISLAGFIWNVWSKFIYPKPRVRVNFSMVTAVRPGGPRDPDPPRAIMLSATNIGPEDVTLRSALIQFKPHWFSEVSYGILNVLPSMPMSTDYEAEYEMGGGPFAGGFPKKLGVGESFRSTSFRTMRRWPRATMSTSALMTASTGCTGYPAATFCRR